MSAPSMVSIPSQRTLHTSSVSPVVRRPLIGGYLYAEALAVVDDRCECTTWCGRRHGAGGGRCGALNDPERPLHVIPGDPSADLRRVVDVDQVLVVCPGCHDRRVESEQLRVIERGLRGDG